MGADTRGPSVIDERELPSDDNRAMYRPIEPEVLERLPTAASRLVAQRGVQGALEVLKRAKRPEPRRAI